MSSSGDLTPPKIYECTITIHVYKYFPVKGEILNKLTKKKIFRLSKIRFGRKTEQIVVRDKF